MRAFFAERADISNFDTIVALATPFGADAEAVERAWTAHGYAAAVDASIEASLRAGVTGVPAFAWPGGPAITGMRPPENLAAELGARRIT